MSKHRTTIIAAIICLLALATPCIWLAAINRQKALDRALLDAAKHGAVADVERALAHGARLDATDVDAAPICFVIPPLAKIPVAKDFLLAAGIRVVGKRSAFSGVGDQAVHLAAENPDVEVLKKLVSLGLKADAQNNNGNQPIHDAAHAGNIAGIQFLLAAGAKVDAANIRGDQPIHEAAYGLSLEAVRLLLASGAKIDAQDKVQWRPIHYAMQGLAGPPQKEMLLFLLASGAKASAKDDVGNTPCSMAEDHVLDVPESADFYRELAVFLKERAAREAK